MYRDSIEERHKEAKGTVIIGYATTTATGDEKRICFEEILMKNLNSLQFN